MPKLIRITTVPQSLSVLLKGQLKFMSEFYEIVAISSSGDSLDDCAKNEGVKVIPVNMTRTISLLNDLKALLRLYKVLKMEKPLIVHTHTPKAGTLGMFAAFLAGVPYRLHTVAGLPLLETHGKKRRLLNLIEKITYGCATNIYPNSSGLYDIIIKQNYTTGSKLKILGNGSTNGINTSYFNSENITEEDKASLRNKLGINYDDYIFIFIGRMVKDKGVNELIDAFAKISKEYKNVKLLMLGKFERNLDPLSKKTESEIETNKHILYVGYHKDVRPYLVISNCFVFPSYREGFPNVVMQAGAMGLPCIVSDINGCNEIIIERENGMLVPPKNVDSLKTAMIKMRADGAWCNSLQRKARQMIVDRYEQGVVWEAILKEYNALIKNHES